MNDYKSYDGKEYSVLPIIGGSERNVPVVIEHDGSKWVEFHHFFDVASFREMQDAAILARNDEDGELAALHERCERLEQENARLKAAAKQMLVLDGQHRAEATQRYQQLIGYEWKGRRNFGHQPQASDAQQVRKLLGLSEPMEPPEHINSTRCAMPAEPSAVGVMNVSGGNIGCLTPNKMEDMEMKRKCREMMGRDTAIAAARDQLAKAFPVIPVHISDTRCTETVRAVLDKRGDLVAIEDSEPVSQHACTCPREVWMYRGCQCGGK